MTTAFSSIVVGTDGSSTATVALGQAIGLARSCGAALHIVSAYEPVPEGQLNVHPFAPPVEVQWTVHARQEVLTLLAAAEAQAREAGIAAVETYARVGSAADAILDVAEERAGDLIVVGNKGMTGATRFLLGSVPNKVSHHAPCSVLIVRTG
ncbi:MAG TPA: universal stress protein [Solirubrobacteraceae bacterium]